MRKLQASTIWLMTTEFKMTRQNRKFYFWQIWHPISTLTFSFYEKWKSTAWKAFLLSASKNRVEKSCFYQQLWVFEIIIKIFNCITKNDDISNIMGTWKLTGTFFSKTFMLHYHSNKFPISTIFPSRGMGRGQQWPLKPLRAIKIQGLIGLIDKLFE